MVMLTLLAIGGLYVFVRQLSATQIHAAQARDEAAALAEAKDALIGDAISQPSINLAGFIRLPDLGIGAEGDASSSFPGNSKDRSAIGKYPWKTLNTTSLRDRHGECLWIVVSGRFKTTQKPDAPNWDTQGQIDIIDGNGVVIATNLAALLAAPGRVLDGQNRALADPADTQCGGNYDAQNYLDAFDNADAVVGEVNYFVGSTNNRVASDGNNKRFVAAETDHYNDRFLPVTVDDIFNPIIKRSDFATAISNLLDDADLRLQVETGHPETVDVSSGEGKEKGTYNLRCNDIENTDNSKFCRNWLEMLFLTQLPSPSPVTIDGAPSATNCNRVLLFSGRKTIGQNRNTAVEKANKDNYLENTNASSFSVPIAFASNFVGASTFSSGTASTDVVRCLP